MTLLFPLLVPLLGAAMVLVCRRPAVAVRVALAFGALEVLAIGNAVWRIRAAGVLPAPPTVRLPRQITGTPTRRPVDRMRSAARTP